MTTEKLKSMFAFYREMLDGLYPKLEYCQMDELSTRVLAGEIIASARAAHYKFMCDKAQSFVEAGRTEKAMRWLGFLQGALWRDEICTLDELKQHVASESGATPPSQPEAPLGAVCPCCTDLSPLGPEEGCICPEWCPNA
jgi:hypothetical protein